MDQAQMQNIWKDILSQMEKVGELKEGEKTVKMVMDETHSGREKVLAHLKNMVSQNKLSMEFRYVPSMKAKCLVFSPVQKQ